MSWRQRAACLGEDPELFFPVGTTGPAVEQLAEAKAVCACCAVQLACLAWAERSGIDHGVWGGLSEEERRWVKRRSLTRQTLVWRTTDRDQDPSRAPALPNRAADGA